MFFDLSAASVNNIAVDTVLSALLIILTVASVIAVIWLLVRNVNVRFASAGITTAFAAVMAAGVVLRIAASFISAGNRQELYALYEAAEEWSKYGPGQYIARYYFQTGRFVYPLQYFYAGITAGTLISAGLDSSSVIIQFIFKLPLIAADVCTAAMLYFAASKYINKNTGVILAGFFMLSPLFIFASAIWTSAYCVFAALIAGSFYAIVEKKYPLALVLYGIAALWIKDATYLFPMYAVYFGYIWFKQLKAATSGGEEAAAAKKDAILLPVTVVGIILCQYLICLPLTIEKFSGNFFSYFYEIFIYPLTQFEYYSNNALSIYNIFARGGWFTDVIFRDQRAPFFVAAFALIIAALTAIIYLYGKNRAVLVMSAAFVLFVLHTTYFDFSITSMIPTLVLMLFAFVFIKDKRLLKVMFAQSLLVVLMMVCVYVFGGYFNNLPIDVFTSADYEGFMQITSTTFGTVAAIALSVLSIANLAYMTKVLINITLSEKRSTLGGNEKAGLATSLRYFITK